MKTTIRKGVFETNSSSTHSVMIQANYPGKHPEKDRWTLKEGFEQLEAMGVKKTDDGWGDDCGLDFGGIDPELARFERTEEAYNTFGMKLLYAIVSFRRDEFLWMGLVNYMKKKLGVTKIYLKEEYDYYGYESGGFGEIDHDSTEALAEIFGKGMSFDGYLFRKDVYIMIDNEG